MATSAQPSQADGDLSPDQRQGGPPGWVSHGVPQGVVP